MLVGFMAAGKSAVGRAAAARLGVPFVDTDAAHRGRARADRRDLRARRRGALSRGGARRGARRAVLFRVRRASGRSRRRRRDDRGGARRDRWSASASSGCARPRTSFGSGRAGRLPGRGRWPKTRRPSVLCWLSAKRSTERSPGRSCSTTGVARSRCGRRSGGPRPWRVEGTAGERQGDRRRRARDAPPVTAASGEDA